MNLVSFAPGFSACFFQPASYLLVMSYYPLVVKVLLIPCLMITFGLYTVRNIRKVNKTTPTPLIHSTTTTANGNSRIVRSKDQQLIKILLMDITVYIVFNFIQSVIVIYQQIGQNQPQTILQSQIGGFIFILALTCSPIPLYIGCYTNLIVSKTFRQEMKSILILR
ncbi:unnamed protein product [Adineta ricciae]|uniref:G protein-coupled receptor n=1 Tax=Adineta ricciae TaxID=249248 RepID=A0A816H515_ADIRI|nr:unnamed protein product [Adineta ricciae]CAF1681443.1 unnamed protein product [Adineta ricciae]